MKAVALCLLAARAASFDFTAKDVGDFLGGVHYHHSTLRSFVKAYVPLSLDIIIPPQPQLIPLEETCGACREHGAKWVMEHAARRIIEMCKMAEEHHCGRAARVCAMMRLHQEVTLGMVMEHVRPFALSAAYCAGKGACRHDSGNSTLKEIVSGHEAHDLVLKHFDEVDWDEVLERAREPEEEEEEAGAHEEGEPEDEQEEMAEREMQACEGRQESAVEAKRHNFCPRCFKMVMKRVMWKATAGVKAMCTKAHDPRTTRMCEFARGHRDVAFGMLLAKVEPWKFAMGACSSRQRGYHHGGRTFWHKTKKFVKDTAHKVSDMITV